MRLFSAMVNPSSLLLQFERRYAREAWQGESFSDALLRFEALWSYARHLNPALGRDWAEDLASDRAIARAVNGLPPISDS
jgi:hypothetical protein